MRDRSNDTAHRTSLEKKLGRKLTSEEIAHHRNEDKSDNAQANLDVQLRGPHTAEHNKHRGLSKLRSSLRMVKEGRKLY